MFNLRYGLEVIFYIEEKIRVFSGVIGRQGNKSEKGKKRKIGHEHLDTKNEIWRKSYKRKSKEGISLKQNETTENNIHKDICKRSKEKKWGK